MEHAAPVDILLVEDNPHDAELAIRALAQHQLADRLLTVDNGADALDFLFCRGRFDGRDIARQPRVVVLDLKLPKVGGLDVLRALRSDERTRSLVVVVLTSSQDAADIHTAYALGANGYVVKPVQFNAFVDAVGKLGLFWLRINEASPPPRMT